MSKKPRLGADGKPRIPKRITDQYFEAFQKLEDSYLEAVAQLEKNLQKDSGIPDAEFFWGCDGHVCGIGNESRTLPLIHRKGYS
jgi:hypothetical protein